ncbi:MAG: hypothetical protein K2L83_05295 [Muribaculaceae bacterium]|nr:hypothetical protein [Muribaculaceae bacterium]
MIPIPDSFISALRRISFPDADLLAAALDTPPATAVRRNHHKDLQFTEMPAVAATGEPIGWCADGFRLAERPTFTLDPLLHAGAYYVQDPSSMIYQQIADRICSRMEREGRDFENDPLAALDFCAAPGGKTTAMINALPYGSRVVANEFTPARGKILRENLEKWGYPFVVTTGSASDRFAAVDDAFDIVAVDAPCSGEGMMRKDEQARRQWSESLTRECATLQRSILKDVAHCVKPGGWLIYSTCTFNTLENEENARFIREELGFEPVAMSDLGVGGFEEGDRPAGSLAEDVEALRFMPHLTRGEGLFVAVFRRPTADGDDAGTELPLGVVPFASRPTIRPTIRPTRSGGKRAARQKGRDDDAAAGLLTADARSEILGWIDPAVTPTLAASGAMVTMLPDSMSALTERMRRAGVNVTGAGLPVAELRGKAKNVAVMPDSRLALSMAMRADAFPRVELDRETALAYLRRETITLPTNIPAGYVVVTYKERPLGMVKNIGNRANNLYPAAWRIRI